MSALAPHEAAFLNAFVLREFRDRLEFELEKKRGRFLDRFCHQARVYLDPRYMVKIPPPNSDPRDLLSLLKKKGAPDHCHCISMNDDIDGKELPLADALAGAVGFGFPSILSCVPGTLAYLETEQEAGPPDRFLLIRKADARH